MTDEREDEREAPTRRNFLWRAAASVIGTALGASPAGALEELATATDAPLGRVAVLPPNVTRTWLGPALWGNRLQDWRLHDGRLECQEGGDSYGVRTIALLTRSIVPGAGAGRLRVRAGMLAGPGREGFCGVLIGVGAGQLDPRAAALAHGASGTSGGFMATFDADGQVVFRDHTSESEPLAWAPLPASTHARGAPLAEGAEVLLDMAIEPRRGGRFDVRLTVRDAAGGRVLADATRRGVRDAELVGGISLVSSPPPGKAGARWWFSDLEASGRKIGVHPERELGPVLGTLYSLNGKVLKLSAQLMPVGESEPRTVRLEIAPPGSRARWRAVATATLAPGYTALFRITDWDASGEWDYRVTYDSDEGRAAPYTGRIRRDPHDAAELRVGLFGCVVPVARGLEANERQTRDPRPQMPQARFLGRYTPESFYFPWGELIGNALRHDPQLLVFTGDQLYEGNPTRAVRDEEPTLDYLYKWYLWLWAFREMTRDTPAILLVDDHDVYHPNVWGEGGAKAPIGEPFWWNKGGYMGTTGFVNLVQRTQCSHNPDPYDPTPVERGITVYYGAFRYGGVEFAVLEDRKWKTTPNQGLDLDVHEARLLGERQEKFLAEWGARAGEPKICLTQSCFGCVQTSPAGSPMLDFDSNGYPALGRERAVRLLRDAGALILSGDQHLASLVRHGIEGFADGPVQFTGPAGAAFWERWFEPASPLPNARGPNSGDFRDAFGNNMRVLAVANPKVSFAEYRRHVTGRGQTLWDRGLKREGYGLVRVKRAERAYVLECWPWDQDPAAAGTTQFEGWPYRLPFDETRGTPA